MFWKPAGTNPIMSLYAFVHLSIHSFMHFCICYLFDLLFDNVKLSFCKFSAFAALVVSVVSVMFWFIFYQIFLLIILFFYCIFLLRLQQCVCVVLRQNVNFTAHACIVRKHAHVRFLFRYSLTYVVYCKAAC